jgi:hypothetical protein
MGVILSALSGLFGSLIAGAGQAISVETLKFIAWRALMMFLVFVALPIVLYNVLTGIVFDFMDFSMSYLTGQGISQFTVQLTGMGAYIASKIQLVQAFSVYMSFVAIRFIMRFIPFFK